MITIEEVIQWRRQFGNLLSCDENQRLFADLALSQHEEIERLRIQLEFTDKIKLRLPPDLNDLVNETLERAAQVCESEKVDYVTTKHPEDLAYNRAIEHCADAIRALKSGEPK